MTSDEIRQSFLKFFKERGHVVVPSSSLIPSDPSVLLTTAGMQQFKPYFTGELDAQKDFGSKNTVSSQKCFRTSDIDEVGDKTHLTFFEMLGNFSFGSPDASRKVGASYFKKEAIHWAYEYVTEVLGIDPERITVTVFAGDTDVPYDKESYDIWHKEIGLPAEKIQKHDRKDNFWGPTGDEGPCGPTTEIYVDGVEIWNLVFNEYYQKKDKILEKLKTSGVDTGMGLERLVATLQGSDSVFATDIFQPLIAKILELKPGLDERVPRILADHLRGAIFLIADGVRPSNKEAGYILRRLLRRVLAYQTIYDVHGDLLASVYQAVKEKFGNIYPEVNDSGILEVMESERDKFQKAIAEGIAQLDKKFSMVSAKEVFIYEEVESKKFAKDIFDLYQTYGLSPEISKEFLMKKFNLCVTDTTMKRVNDMIAEEFKKHQEISRAGAEKKFGGHGLLLDTGELKAKDEAELKIVTRLHTATHLLQAALRKVLGAEVKQMGSDITAERTRFDFTFSRKLTPEEIKKVEDLVNEVIQKDLPAGFIEMPKKEAEKTGALYFFKEKYPEKVKVYYVGHSLEDAFSKEFCGGPHVSNTLTIGKFKILKEEAVGSGIRRLRATVE